uniref:Phlebovirus_G2 domain-containing protein n=1 Tax=Heligmosomoides polygyrus TaxID=6339 RepID=A0A183GTC7_HELPZ
LYLRCDQETDYFSRAIQLLTIDSKRCPHMGSCVDQKCANINNTLLIPELEEGNKYPGRTRCLESCGGLGCDCFYLSSGCLIYRVYAVPTDNKVYRQFHCLRWSKEIKLELVMEGLNKTQSRQYYVLQLMPNVPTPSLHSHFISDDYDLAITKKPNTAPLYCQSRETAIATNCTLNDDRRCTAAENKVQCECPPYDIAEEFNRIELKLPVKTSSWELRRRKNMVIAKIPHLVSSDVMIDFNRTIEQLTTLEDDDVCTIVNAPLEGCYSCLRDGNLSITRRDGRRNSLRTPSLCRLVPTERNTSKLRFHFNTARQSQNCSIRCGKNLRYFTLEGVLKYIGDPQAPLTSLMGTSSAHNDFV